MTVTSARFLVAGFCLVLGVLPQAALATERANLNTIDTLEQDLLGAIDHVINGQIGEARTALEDLLSDRPDFRLAQLVYADLLAGQGNGIDIFGGNHASREEVQKLLLEAQRRYTYQNGSMLGVRDLIPASLVSLSPSQRHALLVDSANSRAYLFRKQDDQSLSIIGDYYVSVGKQGVLKQQEGDKRTPLGVYFVTARLDPSELDDLYGLGALPINYPNEWDQLKGRTGYGIWFHGVPTDTYNRAPFASDGCLALPNANITTISQSVDPRNTPVIIAEQAQWANPREINNLRNEFLFQFESWRRDWESLDFDRYASHYSREFDNGDRKYGQWIEQKRRISNTKTSIEVKTSDLSVFQYPNEDELLVVTFDQHYKSNNFEETTRKRQYWQREDDERFRIVFESSEEFLPVHFRGIPYSARAALEQ